MALQGFHQLFQQEGNWFSQMDKNLWTELLYVKNVPLDGQTRWAKSSSKPVNLPSAWLLIKPLTHKPLGECVVWDIHVPLFHTSFKTGYLL